jgi:hypothetical protein
VLRVLKVLRVLVLTVLVVRVQVLTVLVLTVLVLRVLMLTGLDAPAAAQAPAVVARDGVITGRVVDAATGRPVGAVIVSINGPGIPCARRRRRRAVRAAWR